MIEVKPTPNQDIIDMLEGLLEEAKSGRIQAISIAGVYSGCATFNCFVGGFRPVSLLGEMRLLERDVVDCCTQVRRQPAWEFCE